MYWYTYCDPAVVAIYMLQAQANVACVILLMYKLCTSTAIVCECTYTYSYIIFIYIYRYTRPLHPTSGALIVNLSFARMRCSGHVCSITYNCVFAIEIPLQIIFKVSIIKKLVRFCSRASHVLLSSHGHFSK